MMFLLILYVFISTSSAQECQIPFIYRDVRYTECTTTDDPEGKLWCSTNTDDQNNHLKGNWRPCIAPLYCQFPFIYNKVSYTECTTTDAPDQKLWCSTKTDNQGNHIRTKFVHCTGPSYCKIPFIYMHIRYTECTTTDDPEGKLWCSTKTDNQSNHIKGNIKHCPGSSDSSNDNVDNQLLNAISSFRNFDPQQQQQQSSSSCRLPDGGTGTCGMLSQCGSYRTLFPIITNTNVLQYLIARICRVEGSNALVCCPLLVNQPLRQQSPITNSTVTNSLFPTVCGVSVRNHRVFGGNKFTPGAYPWLVAVGFLGEEEFGGIFDVRCGGSLITQRHVITAAHCWNLDKPTHVRVGEHDLDNNNDGAKDLRIVTRSIHISYNKDLKENDIAILTLEKNLVFDTNINPVCLPFREDLKKNNFEGKNLDICGWGSTDKSGVTVLVPYEAKVRVTSLNICKEIYKDTPNLRLTEHQLCAGGDGKDTCGGDSGGPLNYFDSHGGRYVLAGITSNGKGCGLLGIPGVYLRVGAYMDWIINNVH